MRNPFSRSLDQPVIFLSARRADFVGQVGNLRPIGGALWARPSGIAHNAARTASLSSANLALSALGIFLFASPAFAQVSAAVSGTVTDQSGATIPAAAVTAKNADTGAIRSTVTGSEGRYRLFSLPVGEYEISVQKQGFTAKIRKGVHLTVGQDAAVDVTLEIGDVSQQVVVNADASPVSANETGASGLVGEREVKDLPLNGRSYDELLT